MLVNSIPFLIFFTIVFLPYFTLWKDKLRAQNLWLLLASYFFYGWVSWEMVFLLIGITIVFYFIGLAIPVRTSEKDSYNRSLGFMTIGVILGVGLLLYFKYLNFFIEQFVAFFGLLGMKTNFSSFNIVVPVGVSFFTFKLLSYVIEIYKGNIQPTKDFITFATYVAFFPTIMSGPIDRPADFMGQLTHCRKPEVEDFLDGCKRILWGMFLKMCIADKVSPYTDSVFDNYAHHSGLTIMVAAVLYSFQIYADFCGYSEMAIGVGRLLGVRITDNFFRPLFASDIGDFWRRWHISLMTWLRDYVYFSLGGSRCSSAKIFRNTIATFLVSGLWHGANWTFILWGGYHGILVYLYRQVKRVSSRFRVSRGYVFRYASIVFVFLLCTIGWMVFRANSVSHFILLLSRLGASGGLFFSWALTAILPISILLFKELKDEEGWNIHFLHSQSLWIQAVSLASLFVFIVYTGELDGAKFIYFQF